MQSVDPESCASAYVWASSRIFTCQPGGAGSNVRAPSSRLGSGSQPWASSRPLRSEPKCQRRVKFSISANRNGVPENTSGLVAKGLPMTWQAVIIRSGRITADSETIHLVGLPPANPLRRQARWTGAERGLPGWFWVKPGVPFFEKNGQESRGFDHREGQRGMPCSSKPMISSGERVS